MSSIVQITDHVAQMKALLLEQFKNSRVIQNIDNTTLDFMMKSYGLEIQEIEDMLVELRTERYLANSEGAQLDGMGSIVGESRNGRVDDEYRIAIQVKALLNRSDGTIEQVVEIMDLASGELPTSGHYVDITEAYPACLVASTIAPVTTEPRIMKATLGKARAGGVCDSYIYHTADDDDTYTFSSVLGAVDSSTTQGMADIGVNAGLGGVGFTPLAGNDGQLAPVFNVSRLDDEFSATASGAYCWVVDSSNTPGLYRAFGTSNSLNFTPVANPVSMQGNARMNAAYSSVDKLTYFIGDVQTNIVKVDPSDDSITVGGPLPVGHSQSDLVISQTDGTLYLGSEDLWFYSTNGGDGWSFRFAGFGAKDAHLAWVEGSDGVGDKIFIAVNYQVFSAPADDPLAQVLIYEDPLQREIYKIDADRVDIVISGANGLFAVSKDRGQHWHNRLTKNLGAMGDGADLTAIAFVHNPGKAFHVYMNSDDTKSGGVNGLSSRGGWGAFDDSFNRDLLSFQPIYQFASNPHTGLVIALASNTDASTGFKADGGQMKGVL